MKKLHVEKQEDVRREILICQHKDHIQQVAYSTYHDAITQVCFTCNTVRTNVEPIDQDEGKGEE